MPQFRIAKLVSNLTQLYSIYTYIYMDLWQIYFAKPVFGLRLVGGGPEGGGGARQGAKISKIGAQI